MIPLLCALFFVIAFLYSSVGMGGGSAYLAVMVLLGIPKSLLPAVALTCNTIVSSSSFYHYWKGGHLRYQNVLPFLAASIPCAYLGGVMDVSETLFLILLSTGLAFSGIIMLMKKETFQGHRPLEWHNVWQVALPIGGLLGFLAGMIGIGGGIFLIPILLFCGWAKTKEAAAAGALFILVNSIAGLAGHFVAGRVQIDWMWPVLIAVIGGGWIGARVGSLHYSPVVLQRVFGCIVLFVSGKLAVNLLF